MTPTYQGEIMENWTSCEMYGHVFEDATGESQGSCRDCGTKRED
jgi:hypothetical protein